MKMTMRTKRQARVSRRSRLNLLQDLRNPLSRSVQIPIQSKVFPVQEAKKGKLDPTKKKCQVLQVNRVTESV